MGKNTLGSSFMQFENIPRWIVLVLDFLIGVFALILAYLIRFDFFTDKALLIKEWNTIQPVLAIIILAKPLILYLFKIHKGLVRHTSLEDIRRIFFALLTYSTLILTLGISRYAIFDSRFLLPTSVLIIEFLASLILMVGSRFVIKAIYYEVKKPKQGKLKNILIYGAGVTGLTTKRAIERDPKIQEKIIGFVDDNKKIKGNRLEGTSIYHTSSIKKLIDNQDITEFIIAIQNPDQSNLNKLVDICLENNVAIKRVPSFQQWINGEFKPHQIRDVNINDLLGRQPIHLEVEAVNNQLNGSVVLITGAAGSIGSGIVKQVAHYGVKKLILLDQAESGMYDLQFDIKSEMKNYPVEIVIGDVRDKDRMRQVFSAFHPEIVYHAAAYKHVPLMEDNPSEAIKTNVVGTKNITDLCDEFNVKKMVMISTDKVVNPTNIMGASKRIAELYTQAKNNESTTNFVVTRFGNVLGSNGSVIPLFQRQIKAGGPITVTDEKVTRFFMTITEACQLVLEAGAMGDGGTIFVFDMGEPVKIIDLAKNMIRLSGLELDKDISIDLIGLRPGEKLYEELLAAKEKTLPTHHPKILKARSTEVEANCLQKINQLIHSFQEINNESLVQQMKQIVPEFVSNNSQYSKFD